MRANIAKLTLNVNHFNDINMDKLKWVFDNIP